MQLQKLEKLKQNYKEYSAVFDSLESYIQKLYSSNIYTIDPNIISKKFNISFFEALFILSLVEKQKILKRKYEVWTHDDAFHLEDFEDQEKIPDKIFNPATNKEVDRDNFYVDLKFVINP